MDLAMIHHMSCENDQPGTHCSTVFTRSTQLQLAAATHPGRPWISWILSVSNYLVKICWKKVGMKLLRQTLLFLHLSLLAKAEKHWFTATINQWAALTTVSGPFQSFGSQKSVGKYPKTHRNPWETHIIGRYCSSVSNVDFPVIDKHDQTVQQQTHEAMAPKLTKT